MNSGGAAQRSTLDRLREILVLIQALILRPAAVCEPCVWGTGVSGIGTDHRCGHIDHSRGNL